LLAAERGFLQVGKILIANTADVNSIDHEVKTAAFYASPNMAMRLLETATMKQ
jgi:hypothetical protein